MVGNLVGRQPARAGHLLRHLIEVGGEVGVGHRELPRRVQRVEGRAFLDGQLVERQMVGGVADRLFELGRPGLERLAGPRIDQVEGQARKDLARQSDRLSAPPSTLCSRPRNCRSAIVQRLHAERDAVDAGGAVAAEALGLDRWTGWPPA